MSSGGVVVEEPPEAPAATSDGGGGAGTAAEARADEGNRLAPYNPTHDTAQTAALDLLRLTSRDVFFDLGCGDGRLIVAALERCYDDEYLMRVHQQRFARLRLQEDAEDADPSQQEQGKQPRPHLRNTSSNLGTPSSTHSKKTLHSRSMSTDYSVPHLMRTSSQDDASEDLSVVTPLKSGGSKSSGERQGDINGEEQADGLSALSPPSFHHQPARTPNSPETPLTCNKKKKVVLQLHVDASEPPPPLPSDASPVSPTHANDADGGGNREFERLDSERTPTEERHEEGIPTCIETPSPTGKNTFHAPQISELPTDYSTLAEQLLAMVPSEDEFAEANATAGLLAPQGEEALGGGLRCVGIEYNQALADAAQENVRKSYIYPHVEEKVCIRWGDVLDEWNRGRSESVGRETDDLQLRGTAISHSEHDEVGNVNDACQLTLLDDATAVFVYLLPQGLKKVKPLLYEAAVRRRRQQERRQWQIQQRKEQRQMEEVKEWQEQLQQPAQLAEPLHPLHQPTQEEPEGPFSPSIPRQLVHRKGVSHVSHVSDITDCDFLRPTSRESLESLPNLNEEGVPAKKEDEVLPEIPPFRVASYLFSVPGWTPTKVDRSGKGNCPVYMYENVHESAVGGETID